MDVVARDGRGHMVAGEAVGRGGVDDTGGRGAEACHCGRGHATALVDVTFLEVAASDVDTLLRTRPSEGREQGPSLHTRSWDDSRCRRRRYACAGRP